MRTSLKKLRREQKRIGFYHAWHSPEMECVGGLISYEKLDGKTVLVTVVSRTPNHGCNWDDLKYKGRVKLNTSCRLSYGMFGPPVVAMMFSGSMASNFVRLACS